MDSAADGNAGKPFDNSPTSPSAFTRPGFEVQAAHGPWQQQATAAGRMDSQFSFIEEQEDSRPLLPALFAGSDSYGNTQFGGSSTWDSKLSYLSAVSGDIDGIPLGAPRTPSGHLQVGPHGIPANSLAIPGALQISGGLVHTNAGLDYAESALEHMQAHMGSSAAKMMMLSRAWAPPIGSCPVDPSSEGLPAQVMNFPASNCLPSLPADPGFAERAAKFSAFSNMGFSESSCIGDGNKDCTIARLNLMKPLRQLGCYRTKRSAPNSPNGFNSYTGNKSLENLRFSTKEAGSAVPMEEPCKGAENHSAFLPTANAGGECNEGGQKIVCPSVNESDESMGQEVSSSCGLASMQGNNGRKRKAGSQNPKDGDGFVNNPKDVDPDDGRPKSLGVSENTFEQSLKPQEQSNSGNSEDSTPKSAKQASKPPEAPKPDFIHVRARRGQATDSHSLAERVRREKISERMKFLQDLVPGCSKVTGKAVMLDEIINYVQSLQRQVEFLSMKLAAVNPRVEFNVDNLFAKERPVQPRLATPASAFGSQNPFLFHPLQHHQPPHLQIQPVDQCPSREVQAYGSDSVLRRTMSTPPVMETYGDSASQGVPTWDDELQSVVQMNFAQRQSAHELHGNILSWKRAQMCRFLPFFPA